MTIRNKLILLISSLFATLLLAITLTIYFSFSRNREKEYFKLLNNTAIIKANLLLDAKVAPSVLQLIYRNSENTLFQEEVAVYDTAFRLLYHDAVDVDKVKETSTMLSAIMAKKKISFYMGETQVVGLVFHHDNRTYVLTAAATDRDGLAELANLEFVLATSFLIGVLLILIAGRFFADRALKPVSTMVNHVREITATNLDSRVDEGNGRDEIAELAVTFNAMLDRLERSFDAQKGFVSNISHELRTPLTAMLAELQLSLEKDRDKEDYKRSIQQAITDARKIVRLTNGLLDLAKANFDQSNIAFKKVRLDEILLDARKDLLQVQPLYKASFVFEKEVDDSDFITIHGNEYLLKVAFLNLIENGCKFSAQKETTIAISCLEGKTILRFKDQGIGIDQKEVPSIFRSFFRGSNSKYAEGYGIGLSLTERIISLHKGTISVISKLAQGSEFVVEFPRLAH